MDTKIFSNSNFTKHVLVLCIVMILASSSYALISDIKVTVDGAKTPIVEWLQGSLKKNNLKTTEDLKEFRDAVVSLKVLGSEYPAAEKAIQGYKNYESDNSYSILDWYYISEVTGSCTNNQIFKNFVAREAKSQDDLLLLVNEYYYIFTIYKKTYKDSDKSKDFMQTLGTSFMKYIFPHLTTSLNLKFKSKSMLTKQVGYVLEMASFFKDNLKDINKGLINKVYTEGTSSLIDQSFAQGENMRAFVSLIPGVSDLELNNAVLIGVLSFGAKEFVEKNYKESKQFYNWFLSKQKVVNIPEEFAYLSVLTELKSYVPTVIVNTESFPSSVKASIVDYLGNSFKAESVSIKCTAKRTKSGKTTTFDFTKVSDGSFEANKIQSLGSGVYKLTLEVSLSDSSTFSETLTAHASSEIEIVEPQVTEATASFKVKIDGTEAKNQVDHSFIEYRHVDDKSAVFVDSENVYMNDKYLFKRILVQGEAYPKGEYEVYVGINDQSLKQAKTQKIGTVENKIGTRGYNHEFAAKEEFNPKKVIENLFDPEIDYDAQYTIPMYVFFAAHVMMLLFYLYNVSISTVKIKSTGYVVILLMAPIVVFNWVFWTQINIMQAFAVIALGIPYLAFILWI